MSKDWYLNLICDFKHGTYSYNGLIDGNLGNKSSHKTFGDKVKQSHTHTLILKLELINLVDMWCDEVHQQELIWYHNHFGLRLSDDRSTINGDLAENIKSDNKRTSPDSKFDFNRNVFYGKKHFPNRVSVILGCSYKCHDWQMTPASTDITCAAYSGYFVFIFVQWE